MAQSRTKKPTLDTEAALGFAEGAPTKTITRGKKTAQRASQETDSKSGMVPEGDVRLTANIRGDLHMKLKMEAVQRRTTIGELIEELIENNL
jgi:hypothetical protein